MTVKLTNGAEFLHIPKTGGNWVTSVLRANGLIEQKLGHKHATYDCNLFRATWKPRHLYREKLSALRAKLATFFRSSGTSDQDAVKRFCFVRHPLSWYESWWKYMNYNRGWRAWGTNGSREGWHPCSALNGLGSDDFNVFIKNVVEHRPGYVSELYYAYAKPDVAFIGKTETLRKDLARILDALDLPVERATLEKTPRQNVSRNRRGEIRWDPGLRRTVMQLELPALLHFGYGPDQSDRDSDRAARRARHADSAAAPGAFTGEDGTDTARSTGLRLQGGCHPAVLRAA